MSSHEDVRLPPNSNRIADMPQVRKVPGAEIVEGLRTFAQRYLSR
jgi:hypothetical protein